MADFIYDDSWDWGAEESLEHAPIPGSYQQSDYSYAIFSPPDDWNWWEDETGEDHWDKDYDAPVGPNYSYAIFSPPDEWYHWEDETGEDHWDKDYDAPVGPNYSYAIFSPPDEWYHWEDDSFGNADGWYEELDASFTAVGLDNNPIIAPPDDWSWWEDETGEDHWDKDYDAPVGPSYSYAIFSQPDDWNWWEDETGEDHFDWDQPIGADVIVAQPLQDDWFEEDSSDEEWQFLTSDDDNAVQIADNNPIIVSPDGWYWPEDESSVGADGWQEELNDSFTTVGPDNTPVSPYNEEWDDQDDEDYDLFILDSANFELDPPVAETWDWENEYLADDDWDYEVESQPVVADVIPPVASQPQDLEQPEDDHTDDWHDWEANAVVGPDNNKFIASPDDWNWSEDESGEDHLDWDMPPVGPAFINPIIAIGDDGWDWFSEQGLEEPEDLDQPIGASAAGPAPSQFLDDSWDWDAELGLEEPVDLDQPVGADNNPIIVPSDDWWDWAEDVGEEQVVDETQQSVIDQHFSDEAEQWDDSSDDDWYADEYRGVSLPVLPSQFLDDSWNWNEDQLELFEVDFIEYEPTIPGAPIISCKVKKKLSQCSTMLTLRQASTIITLAQASTQLTFCFC